MKSERKYVALYALLCALMLAAAVTAAPSVAGAESAVNQDRKGVAIEGYDPVAYFTSSKPVKGSREHVASWMGATWWFASADNRDLFEMAPEKYAPQYGGYCAYGVANNYLVRIDPRAWTVFDGRLYLNYSLKVREQWSKDIPGNIKKADANWPKLIGIEK